MTPDSRAHSVLWPNLVIAVIAIGGILILDSIAADLRAIAAFIEGMTTSMDILGYFAVIIVFCVMALAAVEQLIDENDP